VKKFIPTVLYHSKLIKLSQVVHNEVESQSRNQSIDKDNLKDIEQSISQIGLKTPIAVELVYKDDHDEDRSEYKLSIQERMQHPIGSNGSIKKMNILKKHAAKTHSKILLSRLISF